MIQARASAVLHSTTTNVEFHINPTGRFVVRWSTGRRGSDRPQDHCRYLWRRRPSRRWSVFGQGSIQGRPIRGLCHALGGEDRRGGRVLPVAAKIQVAYAIGVAEPVSVMVDTFGTGSVPEAALEAGISEVFDLTPRGILTALDLRKPIYGGTAAYGHFGRSAEQTNVLGCDVQLFSWEDTTRVNDLRDAVRKAA